MRRGRIFTGAAVVIAALALAAPALATDGSATDQGYPCATQPPAVPGQPQGPTTGPCTPKGTPPPPETPPPAGPPANTPPPPVPPVTPGKQTAPVGQVGGVLGTTKTKAAPRATVRGTNGVKGATSPVRATGTLPFTGAQVSIFVLIAAGLLLGGLVLRLASRPKPTA